MLISRLPTGLRPQPWDEPLPLPTWSPPLTVTITWLQRLGGQQRKLRGKHQGITVGRVLQKHSDSTAAASEWNVNLREPEAPRDALLSL